jgi:hypothetical protein
VAHLTERIVVIGGYLRVTNRDAAWLTRRTTSHSLPLIELIRTHQWPAGLLGHPLPPAGGADSCMGCASSA